MQGREENFDLQDIGRYMEVNKKTIYFIFSYIKAGGGAEKQILIQAQKLIEAGFKIVFLARTVDESHFYKYCPSGTYNKNIFRTLASARNNMVFSFLAPDHKYCVFFSILRNIIWIPFERTHPYFYINYSHKRKIIRYGKFLILKLLYRTFAKYVILQSQSAMDVWKNFLSQKADKLFLLPNIYTPTHPLKIYDNLQNKNFKLLMIGRLIDVKNYPFALELFAILKHKYKVKFIVSIFGTGEKLEELLCVTQKLSLSENVVFEDFVPNVNNLICNYDLFVITSKVEGMPNALGEAMGAGLACFSLDFCAGPRDLLGENEFSHDGQIAVSIDLNDSAAQLYSLLQSGSLPSKGKSNVNRIETIYSASCFVSRFTSILNSMTR